MEKNLSPIEIEAVSLAKDGATLDQIAARLRLSYEQARHALLRARKKGSNVYVTRKVNAKKVRNLVQGMPPQEAIEYLIALVEMMADERLESEVDISQVIHTEKVGHKEGRIPVVKSGYCLVRFIKCLLAANERICSPDYIMSTVYYDRSIDDWPYDKIIRIWAHKARKLLKPGWQLETVWGQGYRLVQIEEREDT